MFLIDTCMRLTVSDNTHDRLTTACQLWSLVYFTHEIRTHQDLHQSMTTAHKIEPRSKIPNGIFYSIYSPFVYVVEF